MLVKGPPSIRALGNQSPPPGNKAPNKDLHQGLTISPTSCDFHCHFYTMERHVIQSNTELTSDVGGKKGIVNIMQIRATFS